MKHLLRLLPILLLFITSACNKVDLQGMFVSHATSVADGQLNGLHGGKVNCLHCPMYFKFEANPELVAKIVSAQGLHLVAGPSPEARQIEELVKREVDWWQLADTTAQDKVYWVRYDAKRPELETAFRLLVVKAKHAYFVTSGYFVPENYDQGKS